MQINEKNPPRLFKVGQHQQITIADCATIRLQPDEQVTFISPSGKEHDFAAKDWGYYSTPSVNGRLKEQGFKTALVRNSAGRIYIMVVEQEHLAAFERYLEEEKNDVIEWLDER